MSYTEEVEVTTTVRTERRGFKKMQAPILPTLYCVGTIGKVNDAKISKSGNYATIGIEIMAKGAGKNHSVWFTFHPGWLNYEFDANDLEGREGSPDLVYRSNVVAETGLSTLQGLAGSEENFFDLCESLSNIEFDESFTEDQQKEYLKKVTAVFKKFQKEVNPLIGYTLSQKNEKIGVDPDGKGVYQRTRFYDIFFWYPTDEKIEEMEEKAVKSAEKYNEAKEKNDEIKERNKSLPSDQQEPLVKVPKLAQVTWNDEAPF